MLRERETRTLFSIGSWDSETARNGKKEVDGGDIVTAADEGKASKGAYVAGKVAKGTESRATDWKGLEDRKRDEAHSW